MFGEDLSKIKKDMVAKGVQNHAPLDSKGRPTMASIFKKIADSKCLELVKPHSKEVNALEITGDKVKDLIKNACFEEEQYLKLTFFIKFLALHTKACVNIKDLDKESFVRLRSYVKAASGIEAKKVESK